MYVVHDCYLQQVVTSAAVAAVLGVVIAVLVADKCRYPDDALTADCLLHHYANNSSSRLGH